MKIIILFLCLFMSSAASARDFYGYTNERPLTIVCDWDFRPYEFMSSNGTPMGYNVEVLDLILDKLQIPHKYVMLEWSVATEKFDRHEADLIHAVAFSYRSRPYITTKKYVNYYNLCVARRSDTPPLRSFKDLKEGDLLVLKKDDYASLVVNELKDIEFSTMFASPKDGLTGVRNGVYPYYIWGELPLKNKIKELGLDSIALDDIDIPNSELRLIGYDKDIVDIIDDEYTRLEQAGDLQKIHDRWFNPERVHDDASPVALFIIVGLAIVVLLAFLLSRVTTQRVRSAVNRSNEINQMMEQALNMGEYYVLVWDFHTNLLLNRYGDMLPAEGMAPEVFLTLMGPDEGPVLHELNYKLATAAIDHFDLEFSFNQGTPEAPVWHRYYGSGLAEMEGGKARYLYYTIKDITRQREEEQSTQQLGEMYHKIFETNFIPMSFYDANGRLIDVNKKMRELCEFDDEREQYFYDTSLFDDPGIKPGFDPNSREPYYFCMSLDYPELGIKKCTETRILPIFDDEDKLIYYIATCLDVTNERQLYIEQRDHEHQLRTAIEENQRYEEQLRYLLEESDMYVWTFNINEKLIKFSRSLREPEFTETLETYFAGMDEKNRHDAMQVMKEAVMQGKPFTAVHEFQETPVDKQHAWYSISGMPVHEKDGSVKEYFGLVRNITDLMKAQQLLRDETLRADDSGRMKSAFLANMTHEIRTPLNAIVGFSDLLQVVETSEERKEFIRIIRNNCDMLLRLINDILEASSMGQSLAIEAEDIDLSNVFDDICQTLAQRVENPNVEFQKDNPYDSCPAVLDKGRLQQLLTNFVTNAVKYTEQGHIRVGYQKSAKPSKDGEIPTNPKKLDGFYFYCEDTGAGIPKEKQADVFKRFVKLNDFVQGTGLGLSICQAIVEKCGGKIGVKGDVGVGSTFWFWIPREMKDLKD